MWEQHRLTVLFVTHDVEEAVFISDRIAVMGINPGRITQIFNIDIARPRREEIMETPACIEVQRNIHEAIARLLGDLKWHNASARWSRKAEILSVLHWFKRTYFAFV